MASQTPSSPLTTRLASFAPQALALLRIVAGVLFLQGGIQILFGFPTAPFPIPRDPLTLAAGVLELVGGALVVLGLLTRPAAFVLSGMMAVAYWMAHAPQSVFPSNNMGATPSCIASFSSIWCSPGREPGAWMAETPTAWRDGVGLSRAVMPAYAISGHKIPQLPQLGRGQSQPRPSRVIRPQWFRTPQHTGLAEW